MIMCKGRGAQKKWDGLDPKSVPHSNGFAVSDCWKAYCNLTRAGYEHHTVNHSVEFCNKDGFHSNTIEGHWRHLRASIPNYGRKKAHYASYFAEFLYRYRHHKGDIFHQFIEDIAKIYNPVRD